MNAHLTAITRKKPSAPMQRLASSYLLSGRILDYGCGKGFDADHFGIERFDPYYSPEMPEGCFDTVVCNYVLNVIESPESRDAVMWDILSKLEKDGTAYITVRNDTKDLNGRTKRGTWQGLIRLNLPTLWTCADYTTYFLRWDMMPDLNGRFEA
ncbi:MAG: hypothetical protein AMXMBFR16_11420 [Candidatus Uhrbacteria bacterium]